MPGKTEAAGVCCCGLVVAIAFGVSLPAIHSQLEFGIAEDTVCPKIDGNTFAAKEDWGNSFKWHWNYPGADGGNFIIRQRCPSMTHNAELYVGGIFAGRTEAAYW
jgi:hypothetical protein